MPVEFHLSEDRHLLYVPSSPVPDSLFRGEHRTYLSWSLYRFISTLLRHTNMYLLSMDSIFVPSINQRLP